MIKNPEYEKIIIFITNQETETKGNLTYHLTSIRQKSNNNKINDTKVLSKENSLNGNQDTNSYIHLEKQFDITF